MSGKEPKFKKCASEECENTFRQFNSLQKYCSASCQRTCQVQKDKKLIRESKQFDDLKQVYDVRNKSLSVLEAEAKREFQKYIRWRDRDKECISCQTVNAIEWHGGHYLKAELYSGVVLDEMNCHKQCKKCNIHLDGNNEAFKVGLICRYGVAYTAEIELKAVKTRYYKWSREELIEIKAKYRRLNLEAQKQGL